MHHPRQDNTYHSLCYISSGALAGTRNKHILKTVFPLMLLYEKHCITDDVMVITNFLFMILLSEDVSQDFLSLKFYKWKISSFWITNLVMV